MKGIGETKNKNEYKAALKACANEIKALLNDMKSADYSPEELVTARDMLAKQFAMNMLKPVDSLVKPLKSLVNNRDFGAGVIQADACKRLNAVKTEVRRLVAWGENLSPNASLKEKIKALVGAEKRTWKAVESGFKPFSALTTRLQDTNGKSGLSFDDKNSVPGSGRALLWNGLLGSTLGVALGESVNPTAISFKNRKSLIKLTELVDDFNNFKEDGLTKESSSLGDLKTKMKELRNGMLKAMLVLESSGGIRKKQAKIYLQQLNNGIKAVSAPEATAASVRAAFLKTEGP